MKSMPLVLLLAMPFLSFAQITFEEVVLPEDFNFNEIRQSPQGEYFVQAGNDNESIYTSLDGIQWEKEALPDGHPLEEIQFFSDGTPLLTSSYYPPFVRRNGEWSEVRAGSSWQDVVGCFIKDDSLFVQQNSGFYYSLNQGQTFELIFTAGETIVDHTGHLWKLEGHFVMYHTAGAADFLSVFNRQGDRVLFEELNLSSGTQNVYNECGEVLILDRHNYYKFSESGLELEAGMSSSITPAIGKDFYMTSVNGNYYLRNQSILYKTSGCNFNWADWKISDEIQTNEHIWINAQEDVFLNKPKSDRYLLQKMGSSDWVNHAIAINYPHIYEVEESIFDRQAVLTSTALFTRSLASATWTEIPIPKDSILDIGYSPDGHLYVLKPDVILNSEDNGQTFSAIPFPLGLQPKIFEQLEVLGDGVLFVHDGIAFFNFYSRDNGTTWTQVDLGTIASRNIYKLTGDHIVVAGADFFFTTDLIDLSSGLVTSLWKSEASLQGYVLPGVLEDGSVYFSGEDFTVDQYGMLFRYRLHEGYVYLGNFPELQEVNTLLGSGQELYGFGASAYYHFNGDAFDAYPYAGLPATGGKSFLVAKDEHLFAIHGSNRTFRSRKPLSSPKMISGTIMKDVNQDCDVAQTDLGLEHWKVKIEGGDYMSIRSTDDEGRFHFRVPEGNYTLSTLPVSHNWNLCEAQTSLTVDDITTTASFDFKARAVIDCATLEIDFSTPRLRRCFDNYYQVRVRNTGPAHSEATTVTLQLDPFFEFFSATIPWTEVSPGILEFNLGVLEVNQEVVFRIEFKLSCDAELGQEHCLQGSVFDPQLCGLTRSDYEECQENIGSYDPNDKRMFSDAGVQTERVDKGEYIQYHIRFQNTGTDTAFDVRVQDPLSPQLDLSTFEMLSASHPYTYEIKEGPELVVKFENILLPDSTTNEAASHGFFKFRIKPLAQLDYGTTIPNEADIYFDFNEPVLTGEVTLLLSPASRTQDAASSLDFSISPNPVVDFLSLHIAPADQAQVSTYEIIDFLGRSVIPPARYTGQRIAVGQLSQGVYSVVLRDRGMVVGVKGFVRG